MIVTEYYMTRPDGVVLIRTYSNERLMIEKVSDGTKYIEAIDPEDTEREYVESSEPIVPDEKTEAENIVDILLGRNEWPY